MQEDNEAVISEIALVSGADHDGSVVLAYTPSEIERKIAEANLVKNTVPGSPHGYLIKAINLPASLFGKIDDMVVDLTSQTGELTMTMRETKASPVRDYFNQWAGIVGVGKVGEDDASS